jgi:hypothetical protein
MQLLLLPCLLSRIRYYKVNNGQRPGVLLVYRDGVSDGELARVRLDEVTALIQVSTHGVRCCAWGIHCTMLTQHAGYHRCEA